SSDGSPLIVLATIVRCGTAEAGHLRIDLHLVMLLVALPATGSKGKRLHTKRSRGTLTFDYLSFVAIQSLNYGFFETAHYRAGRKLSPSARRRGARMELHFAALLLVVQRFLRGGKKRDARLLQRRQVARGARHQFLLVCGSGGICRRVGLRLQPALA